MKIAMRQVFLTFVLLAFAAAPAFGQVNPMFLPPTETGQTSAPFLTQLNTRFPGIVWLGGTFAGNGLGYNTGGYISLGLKTRLGEDMLGGRWLAEGQGHIAYESGEFFYNLGVERVFTIDPANADVGMGIWFDVDKAPQNNNFSFSYQQIGVSGFIRKPNWELGVNGYFPIDNTGFVMGNSAGGCVFFQNSLLLQSGIDTALQGMDAELRLRPFTTSMWQGTVDLGGYYYRDSDEEITGVAPFGGVRVRVGMQTLNGIRLEAELNHDERFDTTGFFRFVLNSSIFGNYDPSGNDMTPATRNDHIVVFHQDPVFAIDPRTGAPYRIVHVDNANTDPAGGAGTFENPFTTLALADGIVNPGNSIVNDIIFVNEGVGPYADSISLLTGQFLFGDGIAHTIPIQTGNFLFCSDVDGFIPTIAGVNLGVDTRVEGFNITPPAAGTAISAIGLAGNTLTTVNQVQITGGQNGVAITNSSGTFNFIDSNTGNFVGMFINDQTGIGFSVVGDGGGLPLNVNYAGDMFNTVAANGQMISIVGTAPTSTINFVGGNFLTDISGAGILLDTVAGVVNITTPTTLTSTNGSGITVQNSAATALVNFVNTTIINSTIAGVTLNNNPLGSVITFDTLNITETLGAVGFSAVDTSFISMTGNNSITSAGPVGNMAMFLNGNGPAATPITLLATVNTITSTNSVSNGINFSGVAGTLTANQITIDESTLDSILIQNEALGGLVFSPTVVNITNAGVAGGAFGNGVRLNTTATSTYNFGTLNIETDNGNGLFATTAGTINVGGGTITANGGAAIIINPTEFHMTFGAVTSNNSISDGIAILGIANNTGRGSDLSILNTTVTGAAGAGIRVNNIQELGVGTELTANFGASTIDGNTGITVNDNNDADTGESLLTFNNLGVLAFNGDGLFIDDNIDGANAATNFTFNLVGNTPNVTSFGGTAIDITGATGQTNGLAGWTFNNVSSFFSNNEGILLDRLNQTFTISGLTTVANSAGDGVVIRNMAPNVTLANVNLNGTAGDGIDVSAYTGTFTVSGGTVQNATASGINIANGGSDANFNISNLGITFLATANNTRGISVSSGTGLVTIANNTLNLNNTTNSTGIFVQGNDGANTFNLGTGISVNNTTSNLGAGSVNFNFNNGAAITGDIEIDGVTFNP